MAQSKHSLTIARATSRMVAVVGLVVLSYPLALIALTIKLNSPGPVFFVQDRLDRRGRRFHLFKFRTTDNHDRITSVGRWLRRYRLDELPKLINVIRGDMDISETGWKFGPL